jgi:hypothetical protein
MGWFSKLIGTEKVIDAGMNGIDKAFYTDEEKAEDKLRRMQMKTALLKAYEPFKVAQRLLALIFSIPYVIAWFSLLIASFFMDVDKQFKFLIESDMALAVLIILGFYFLGGASESIFKFRTKIK